MRVIIADSAADVARWGADLCCQLLQSKPDAVLGLATGSTPIALYQELIRRYRQGRVSFQQVRSFNLDEYIGLRPDHPQSYRYFMNEHLFNHIDIKPANTHVPDGLADPQREAEHYEALIRQAGGIELQVLGIGRNGHIGFNEPSSSLQSRTRVTILTQETIDDNSRFFQPDEFQPHLAITMGIGTILEARKVVLLATGKVKAPAIRAMVEGPLATMNPASALQLHNNVVIIVDEVAAGELALIDYYRWVQYETQRLGME